MKIGRRAFAAMIPATVVLQAQTPAPETMPQLGSELVKDWIVKAHQRKIDVMKGLLEREPALLQSAWDWGAGDFESAIQAAAHTGSRDMALFLIDRGVRFDLFAAAMLGQLAAFKAVVEACPATLQVAGAHGIPLLSHAIQGEAAARGVFDYLMARGVDVNARSRNGSTPLMTAVHTGQGEIVRLLLSKGADPKAKAANGGTALSLSLKRGDAAIIQALKDAGATE
jgi:ankyrin repeat protein